MATYVISDIHGQYDLFVKMLEKIALKDEDTLYVLGDVLDRGPHPIRTLRKLMEMPNAICIVGNHELMALECLKFLMQEVTEETLAGLDREMLEGYLIWIDHNGGRTTLDEFRTLDAQSRQDVIDFIGEFDIYEEICVAGRDYLLVHAGLGNFYPGKDIEDYSLADLVWSRAEYDIEYYPDKYVVTGHTPTQGIPGNPKPGYIYRQNNHIAIDCGSYILGGRLAAICLDTGEEYYVSRDDA
ncbi:MAG: serine/threonine protein phosphatase [Lachnospiraceae bacterium]|nr:serine/threonine protein phosphatase [Lachnospiraceae bacterium]